VRGAMDRIAVRGAGGLEALVLALPEAARAGDGKARPVGIPEERGSGAATGDVDGEPQQVIERGIGIVAPSGGSDGVLEERVGGHGRAIVHAGGGPSIEQPFPGTPEPAPILAAVKLVVAIVQNEDAGALVDGLLEREFRATRLHSSGGFLKGSNATIVLGVEDDQVESVLDIVRAYCTSRTQAVSPMPPIMEPGEFFMPYPIEVDVGGATVFVLPVERVERL
jgi:uncharacterized protein YaaQ